MLDDFGRPAGPLLSSIQHHWRALLIEGIVLILLGVAAIAVPLVAGLAIAILFGWLILIGGVVGLMMTVAGSSFWVHQIRLVGLWSPIHLLSILVLVTVPLAVWRAHHHRVTDHRRIMISVFSGALVIAGLFTLLPGRIMQAVVFGP